MISNQPKAGHSTFGSLPVLSHLLTHLIKLIAIAGLCCRTGHPILSKTEHSVLWLPASLQDRVQDRAPNIRLIGCPVPCPVPCWLSCPLLAQQVQAGVSLADVAAPACLRRLDLIRSGLFWLNGEFAAAQELAEAALLGFTELQDGIGCADAHWLLAWVAHDQGDLAVRKHGKHQKR